MLVQNSVWKDSKGGDFGFVNKSEIERNLEVMVDNNNINSVWNKDGYLLGAKVNILGMKFSMILQDIPKERYFGDVNEKNDFQGIQEEEL